MVVLMLNDWLLQLRQAKTEIVSASKVAYRFLLGVTNNVVNGNGNVRNDPDTPSNSSRGGGSPRFQGTWFKNLITNGAKPSSSSEIQDNRDDGELRQRQDGKSLLCRSPSSSHDSS